MKKLLERADLAVEAAVINDVIKFENATELLHDEHAAIVRVNDVKKCVFEDIDVAKDYIKKHGIAGRVCLLNMPLDAPTVFGLSSEPCRTFAYLRPLPPQPSGKTVIKRLAPSLAETVRAVYVKKPTGYTVEQIAELMRTKGVFGALENGKLAGFVGRHYDGNMGMLEVLDGFRGRGIGTELSKFIIGYVMTFGRTPICDVYISNAASLYMQKKLGSTCSKNYTVWGKLE